MTGSMLIALDLPVKNRFVRPFLCLLFLVGLLILSQDGSAQSYFNKRINVGVDSFAFGWGIVEASNGNGYVLYGDENLSHYTKQRQFVRIDANGKVLQHKTYREDSIRLWNGANGGTELIAWKDGYLLAGSREDMHPNGEDKVGTLWKLDENLDTVWTRTYDHWPNDSNESGFKDIEYLPEEEAFVLTGYTQLFKTYEEPYGWIVKTDTSGNLLWEKVYGDQYDLDALSDLTPAWDSGYMAVGGTHSFSDPDGAWVVRLDTAGNKQWQKTYGSDSLVPYWLYNILKTPDSNYIACGQHYDDTGDMVLYYDKFTPNGSSLWKQTFWDSSGMSNPNLKSTEHRKSQIHKGALFTLGWQKGFDIPTWGTGYLHKLSLEDGDRYWKRRPYLTTGIHNADGHNDLYDMVRTDSGGFIAVGAVQPSSLDTGNTDIWIVGMDSVGCDTPNCAVSTPRWPEPPKASFELYPNPNDGRFTVRSTGSGRYKAVITVRDLEGKVVLRERIEGQHPYREEFNLPRRASGPYLVEWKEGGKSYVKKIVVE